MDWVLANLAFVKCYINVIIIFSLILGDRMCIICRKFWFALKNTTLNYILVNVDISGFKGSTWVMNYFGGLGV